MQTAISLVRETPVSPVDGVGSRWNITYLAGEAVGFATRPVAEYRGYRSSQYRDCGRDQEDRLVSPPFSSNEIILDLPDKRHRGFYASCGEFKIDGTRFEILMQSADGKRLRPEHVFTVRKDNDSTFNEKVY